MGSRFDRHSPELRAQQWHKQCRPRKFVLLLLAFLLLFQTVTPAAVNEVRRVLVFNDFDPIASPGVAVMDQAIFTAVSQSRYQIEWYDESLGANLFTDEASQRHIREWYVRKYQDSKPNLIIAVGPASLQFMIESHERFFPGIPIIFCGSSEEMLERLKPDSHFTGVWGRVRPEETFKAALHLQPTTKHVVVVGGVGAYDRYLERIVKGSLQNYESRFEFTYLTDQDMPTLLGRLSRLPNDTIVLYTSIFQDAAGAHFIDANQSAPLVVGATNMPVFVLFDVNFGTGAVGGDIISFASDGKIAGQMAVSILNGEKLGDIPVVKNANVMMFDWRALKRWGLREGDLPPESVVLFREMSVWERTRRIWASGLLIILALSLLATYLQYSRTELKKSRDTQVQLSGHLIKAQEEERSRLASELHDDFSQRLALLGCELQITGETSPSTPETLKQKLDELRQSVNELNNDLHTASHRLHSSALDTLGLVAALKALCREFGAKQGIEVDFTSGDIPPSVRPDVALCLFRIAQEGLQNLKKHSGAQRAQLSVRHRGDRLFLSLCDEGVGFDANKLEKPGLGILSMQGRARQLGGEFEVHSKPGKGTRIDAWVPLDRVADRSNV
jgi:signal transduction histidine kinase